MTMKSPLAPKRIGSIESISYYCHTQKFDGPSLAAGRPNDLLFFHGQAGTDDYQNDLGKVGQLPQSASGWLRQVMIQPFSEETDATDQRQGKILRTLQAMCYNLKAEIYVADILVATGPLAAYGAPGPIVQGLSDPFATQGAQMVTNAMSGLPMMDHPIHSRNTIRVRVGDRGLISPNQRPEDATSAAQCGLHVIIGVAQATAIAGSKE